MRIAGFFVLSARLIQHSTLNIQHFFCPYMPMFFLYLCRQKY
uniref:Uncharacterized protein n=2 Tax=unclassified Caudoviricetes TaxID=2788787 RepID=A0A8S5VAQ6_9CAUD|nr:MAG TPA: hypothetical protein [Siphoviridae sp. ctfrT39]DAG03858.1 MAG TPA: hypothetical protein [Siphoviridae sp. ct0vA12]